MNSEIANDSTLAFTSFQTALGMAAVAWTDRGLVALQLPDTTEDATISTLRSRTGNPMRSDPPAAIATSIDLLTVHLGGTPQDLTSIPVDLRGIPDFQARVYSALRQVVPGKTITYGELANVVGSPGAARAVGRAMALNPLPIVIPCHRVLAANERLCGFSAPGGIRTKTALLASEGVHVDRP